MANMDIHKYLDSFVLGIQRPCTLPAIACQAIDCGFDTPLLYELAASDGRDENEIRKLFIRVVSELGFKLPSEKAAAFSLFISIVRDIVSGEVAPYVGAKRIWTDLYSRFPDLSVLKPFVGFASEYEDDLSHRDEYNRMIISECESILRSESD